MSLFVFLLSHIRNSTFGTICLIGIKNVMPMHNILAFCGLDGAGKTTQATLLYYALSRKGYKCAIGHPCKKGHLTQKLIMIGDSLNKNYEELFGSQIIGTILLEDIWNYCLTKLHELSVNNDFVILERCWVDFHIHSMLMKSNSILHQHIISKLPLPLACFMIDVNPSVCLSRIASRKDGFNCKREVSVNFDNIRDELIKIELPYFHVINANACEPEEISAKVLKKLTDVVCI